MDEALRAQGFSAPQIYAADLDGGFLVLENLGAEGVVGPQGPIPERYGEATILLAHLHVRDLPDQIPLAGARYAIPPYDLDALLTEAELLLDWYAPHVAGQSFASGARAQYENAWRSALAGPLAEPKTWVLRDYHSPNLIWLAGRKGVQRVGLIDFQDCVMGPAAYDVASLLQDARLTVSDELELKLLGAYMQARRKMQADFDMAGFAASYAVMGAQRASKILGIFTRLDRRDGKPQYLAHIPRIKNYLRKNLGHPALAEVKAWFDQHLQGALADEVLG